jgi:HD-like signal output (HDOD) protein
MILSSPIEKHLNDLSIHYHIESFKTLSLKNERQQWKDYALRGILLKYKHYYFLAILLKKSFFDLNNIKQILGFMPSVQSKTQTHAYFKSKSDKHFSLLPHLLTCKVMIDSLVLKQKHVFVPFDQDDYFIQLDQNNCHLLYHECDVFHLRGDIKKKDVLINSESSPHFTSIRFQKRIQSINDIPAMPRIANDLILLRADPYADVKKLSHIIAQDPALSLQVMSWANASYYGYQGEIDSIETAIARVLGFDLVFNLALGLSIGKSFSIPLEGPLGIKAFWKQAIYNASLSQILSKTLPYQQRPTLGLVYLSGLLHTIGRLLIGHLFHPQFHLIHQTIEANHDVSIEAIEYHILGFSHQTIGGWLMKHWEMPEPLIIAVCEHHQKSYQHQYNVYSNMVLMANMLLKSLHIQSLNENSITQWRSECLLENSDLVNHQSLFEHYSFTPLILKNSMDTLQKNMKFLNKMAKQLVA